MYFILSVFKTKVSNDLKLILNSSSDIFDSSSNKLKSISTGAGKKKKEKRKIGSIDRFSKLISADPTIFRLQIQTFFHICDFSAMYLANTGNFENR